MRYKHLGTGFLMDFKKSNYSAEEALVWFGWVSMPRVANSLRSNRSLLIIRIRLILRKFGSAPCFLLWEESPNPSLLIRQALRIWSGSIPTRSIRLTLGYSMRSADNPWALSYTILNRRKYMETINYIKYKFRYDRSIISHSTWQCNRSRHC
jgi:hypothetical protein